MMKYVDVVVDGEFILEERDVKLLWKGSKNQRVIDVKRTLAQPDPLIPVLHAKDYEQVYVHTEKPDNMCSCCD